MQNIKYLTKKQTIIINMPNLKYSIIASTGWQLQLQNQHRETEKLHASNISSLKNTQFTRNQQKADSSHQKYTLYDQHDYRKNRTELISHPCWFNYTDSLNCNKLTLNYH